MFGFWQRMSSIWSKILPQKRKVRVYRWAGVTLIPERIELTVTDSSIEALSALRGLAPHVDAMIALAPARLAHGDHVWIARESGRLAHIAWSRREDSLDLTYELGAGAIYPLTADSVVLYDCWTPHSERGRGAYPAVLSTLARRMNADTWIYCDESNLPSRRGIEKAGFHLRCRVQRWWFLGCGRGKIAIELNREESE